MRHRGLQQCYVLYRRGGTFHLGLGEIMVTPIDVYQITGFLCDFFEISWTGHSV